MSWRSPLSYEMWTLLSELSVHLLRQGTHLAAQSQLGFQPRGLQIILLNITIILHCRRGPLGHGFHLHPAFLSSHLSCQLYQLVSCLRSLPSPTSILLCPPSCVVKQNEVFEDLSSAFSSASCHVCDGGPRHFHLLGLKLLSSKSSSSALPMMYNVWAIMLQVRVFEGNICTRDS